MSFDDERGKTPPLPTDVELDAELARMDPRHWDDVRARVRALRAALADPDRGAAARAADALDLTSERIHQLVRRWRETGSVAALAPRSTISRRLPDRLSPEVVALVNRAIPEVLATDPLAGVEDVATEIRLRCAAAGLTPPSPVTIRRRVERTVEDAGGWTALAGRRGPDTALVVDRTTLGLPMRLGERAEPGLPQAVIVAGASTGLIRALILDEGEPWVGQVATALVAALGTSGPDAPPLPATVEVDRDADPAWRAVRAAMARAGLRATTAWSPKPGAGRRLPRVIGSRIAGIPALTRGMGGDGPERLRRWLAGDRRAVAPVDPDEAVRILAAAVIAHNSARPSPDGAPPTPERPDDQRRRADLLSALTSIARTSG